MLLLLPDQQLGNPGDLRRVVLLRKPIGRAQQIAAGGLLPELKSRNGRSDETPLCDSQDVGNPVGQAARMLGVVLEMIEPDLQGWGASGSPRKRMTVTVGPRLGWRDGAIRANSGTLRVLIKGATHASHGWPARATHDRRERAMPA